MEAVKEKPKVQGQQQQPPKTEQPITSVPVDVLANVSNEKYVRAMTDGAEKYLEDRGWVREGANWREPGSNVGETLVPFEILANDGKAKETVQRLVVPPTPWLYTMRQAIVRQQAIDKAA